MKKTLSLLLTLLLMLSTASAAFAAEQTPSAKRVENQINGAVSFLTAEAEEYTVDTAADFALLLQCGADVSEFSQGFLKSVKDNLDKNNGKIIGAYGESLATYGAVIDALDMLGENTEDFYGYDINSAFFAMDPGDTSFSPYYYRYIIRAAVFAGDTKDFARAVCDTYIENYYTMGKGVDYYGFSCDNLAYFIDAVTWLTGENQEIITDAFKVLDKYHTQGGYFSDSQYSTDPNTDSTALALMALCAKPEAIIDDFDSYLAKLNGAYNELCGFESEKEGVFVSSYTGEPDLYATKEALIALSSYYPFAVLKDSMQGEDNTEKYESTTAENKESTSGVNSSKKSPNTGADFAATAIALSAAAALSLTLLLKRKKSV